MTSSRIETVIDGHRWTNQLFSFRTTRDRGFRFESGLESGGLQAEFGLEALDPAKDRIMLCGSSAMLGDLSAMLTASGFRESLNATPGDFVVEKIFADQVPAKRLVSIT